MVDDLAEEAGAPDRDALRRALRSLEDAKARVERDASRVRDEIRVDLVSELLPVIDDTERMIEAAEDSGCDPAVVDGLRMLRSQLDHVLARYGVERFTAAGRRFDPALHDALMTVAVADPAQDHRVIEEVAPGYRIGDNVLRPARVTVGLVSRRD